MNARLDWGGKLTSEQSRVWQDATRAFVGPKVNSRGNNEEGFKTGVWLFFLEWRPILNIDHVTPNHADMLSTVFGGAEQCDD